MEAVSIDKSVDKSIYVQQCRQSAPQSAPLLNSYEIRGGKGGGRVWGWFRQWRRQRVLRRAALPDELWDAALAEPVELFAALDVEELARLRELTTLLLAQKEFYGANGLELTPFVRASIAVQAALPILNLGLACYRGWVSIVVYPESFIAPREEIDEDGIVHRGREVLVGESWDAGPVVLSWADCAPGAYPHGPAANVVIHELAHKLDMLSGTVNGTPPLHRTMDGRVWDAAMGAAFESLQADLAAAIETPIDEYAAQDPGEFFAVCSEYFFMAPAELHRAFPEVYRQLALYYRLNLPGFTRG